MNSSLEAVEALLQDGLLRRVEGEAPVHQRLAHAPRQLGERPQRGCLRPQPVQEQVEPAAHFRRLRRDGRRRSHLDHLTLFEEIEIRVPVGLLSFCHHSNLITRSSRSFTNLQIVIWVGTRQIMLW